MGWHGWMCRRGRWIDIVVLVLGLEWFYAIAHEIMYTYTNHHNVCIHP